MKKSCLFGPIAAGALALFPMATKALCAPPMAPPDTTEQSVVFTEVNTKPAWSEVRGNGFTGICPNQETTITGDIFFMEMGIRVVRKDFQTVAIIAGGKLTELHPTHEGDTKNLYYLHAGNLDAICSSFITQYPSVLPDTEYMDHQVRTPLNNARLDQAIGKVQGGKVAVSKTPEVAGNAVLNNIAEITKEMPDSIRKQLMEGALTGFAPRNPPPPLPEGYVPDEISKSLNANQAVDDELREQGIDPNEVQLKETLEEHAARKADIANMEALGRHLIGTNIKDFPAAMESFKESQANANQAPTASPAPPQTGTRGVASPTTASPQ